MIDFSSFPRFEALNGKPVLSIDYGETIIGLAYMIPGVTPIPKAIGRIVSKGLTKASILGSLKTFLDDYDIEVIVIGLPLNGEGQDTDMSLKIKDFGEELTKSMNFIINETLFFQDEHLTTQMAKDRMKSSPEFNYKIHSKKIDEVSAVIILEDFLRSPL